MKLHPRIKNYLEGGRCISYGARALNEGGFQSIPKLSFPGGMIAGCSAGFMNVPRIKGSHTAMKSGILAADSILEKIESLGDISGQELRNFDHNLKDSWIWKELKAVRNVRPAFNKGIVPGMVYSGLSLLFLKGKEPWTFSHHGDKQDHELTRPAKEFSPVSYPKPDGSLTFDILSNLARSGTNHEHDQPGHLQIKKELQGKELESLEIFDGPEQRFCPAKVYEFIKDENDQPKLQINAQNCLHCKTCDIKTPMNYIQWTVPEGSGGPAYSNM